jgi:nucleoside-diphosphate-sugar epimerase
VTIVSGQLKGRPVRVVVIGGGGFIGSALVPRLVDGGNHVTVFHRRDDRHVFPNSVRWIVGDRRVLSRSRDALRSERPDVVIDLILSSGPQALDLMQVFRGFAGRLVVASSMDVYKATSILHRLEGTEDELQPLPLTEDSALRSTFQTYPAAQIEELKRVFGWLDDEYDKIPVERAVMGDPLLRTTVLRLPMLYGPGDRLHRLWPYVKRMRDRRSHIILPQSLADWRSPRGFVENVAAAIALAATDVHAADRTFNVAESDSYSELEWVELLAARTRWRGDVLIVPDRTAPPHLVQRANFRQHWVADSSRIRVELGYREPVSRDDAIDRTIAWQLAHPPEQSLSLFDYDAEDAAIREHIDGRERQS